MKSKSTAKSGIKKRKPLGDVEDFHEVLLEDWQMGYWQLKEEEEVKIVGLPNGFAM